MEKGIIHLERNVAGGEIERDDLVVPKDATMAKFEAIDGKGEELLDSSRAPIALTFALRKIGGAVGIESDVDRRAARG